MTAIIRLATDVDAEQILAIYAPFCEADSPVSFEFEPPTVEEMRRRILKTLERFPWLICEDEGDVTGYAYAGPHRERAAYAWSVDVSVYIREGRRRSGPLRVAIRRPTAGGISQRLRRGDLAQPR